jgi:hypothetical protein
METFTAFGKLLKANDKFDHLPIRPDRHRHGSGFHRNTAVAPSARTPELSASFQPLKRQSIPRCKQVRMYQQSSNPDFAAQQSFHAMPRARRRRRVRLSSLSLWEASWVRGGKRTQRRSSTLADSVIPLKARYNHSLVGGHVKNISIIVFHAIKSESMAISNTSKISTALTMRETHEPSMTPSNTFCLQ